MIKRTFDITARIEQGQIPFCFQCVQNDKDVYVLRIRITDGGQEIDYGEISDATITFALANGSVVQSDPERLAISSGGITYEMGTTEISCPGKVLASIQLFGSSGERLTTARFQFEVVADLISPKAVQSESRFPLLQQLVADVEQLKQDIVDLQIPDNSIMDEKLSNAAGQIKQRFASHKAENVTDGGGVHGLRIESGSFTPYITGSTGMGTFAPTYTEQSGWYVKVNNLVKFGLRLTVSSFTGDVSGIFRIGGLPFVSNVRVGLLVSHVANMKSDPSVLTAVTVQGQPFIALGKMLANLGVSAFQVTDMGTNFDISITGEYRTAA